MLTASSPATTTILRAAGAVDRCGELAEVDASEQTASKPATISPAALAMAGDKTPEVQRSAW